MSEKLIRPRARNTAALALAAGLALPALAEAGAPPIRTSATGGGVPACATPARLNAFLADRNRQLGYSLNPRFRDIAVWYKRHGERHRVRWDYAFFQMLLETNFLSYRRASGKSGDVDPKQNNFAGLGTTGGGVPGDSYPDVSTGVLAQIQHLVVYSGERLNNPVGHRTRLKQDVILKSVAPIVRKRPVTFADLARRWAADRYYGRSIERLAAIFRAEHCRPGDHRIARATKLRRPPPPPARRTDPAVAMAPAPSKCQVQIASYGPGQTLLIETIRGNTVRLTALEVIPGFEQSMAESFIATYAPTGRTLASFSSSQSAIAEAQAICKRITKRS